MLKITDDRRFRKYVIDTLAEKCAITNDDAIVFCQDLYCELCRFNKEKDCKKAAWNYFNTHVDVKMEGKE